MKAKDLRKSSRLKKEPCCICGDHERISESHHLISLASAANYICEGLKNNVELELHLPEIWLCPNHHSYLHYFQKKQEMYLLGNYLFYEAKTGELLAYDRLLQMIIKWYHSAIEELIRLWSEAVVSEQAFKSVYRIICQDLRYWEDRHGYLKRIIKKRRGEFV